MVSRLVLAALLMVLAPPVARGQEPPEGEARTLFEEGLSFARQQRWAEAVERLERSNELVERTSTTFNLAIAKFKAGQSVGCIDAIERFMALSNPSGDLEKRKAVAKLRAEAEARVHALSLAIDPETAAVAIDGVALERSGSERLIYLEPGDRVLTVTAAGYEPAKLLVKASPGGTEARQLQLSRLLEASPGPQPEASSITKRPVAEPVDLAPSEAALSTPPARRPGVPALSSGASGARPDEAEDSSWLSSPWLWIGVAAVVGGAVATAVVLTGSGEPEPDTGSLDFTL